MNKRLSFIAATTAGCSHKHAQDIDAQLGSGEPYHRLEVKDDEP
ncbi:hypothetical protein [Pseudomonas fluorescens]|uniref:Lipoprotein n=1 Tax=Pseudomonas fluorescens TaxID=294 RepID=A0A5E7AUL1_PSEFL|nr:hypothetical protein [Pseudomonas fluorescens]VVN83088.1 hypothetical protein PS691_01253 [Pseudomonas fluorescens]